MILIETFCKRWRRFGIYKCDCGKIFTTRVDGIKNGHTKSCGCLNSALASKRARTINKIHGLAHSLTYGSWRAAKSRCENPHSKEYCYYGKRGIEMRLKSVVDIIDAIGPRPNSIYSLDRIDNNGHYEKNNVRWATAQEQAQNRRQRNYV